MERVLGVALLLLVCAVGATAQNATNCSSDPSPCGETAFCTDTEDGPFCSCEVGYQVNSSKECEECPWGTWGWNCSSYCNCSTFGDNSTTCDPVDGACPDDGIYNCNDNPCGELATCENVYGANQTFICSCPSGYRLMNETQCEECDWNTWGIDCSENCTCEDNSTTCNAATGVCPEDEPNCDSNPCSGEGAQCMDISLGVFRCYCSNGSILVNDYECQRCPAGTWGANCTQPCNCGHGNNCNNVNGDCICNSCWTGTSCDDPVGSDCVLDFLEEEDKCENNLKELFGGAVYPTEPNDTLASLVVDLMDLDNAVVVQSTDFDDFSREDVDQGPLVQLTWRVNKNADRPNAEAGLAYLAEQVKLGNIRSTLIINSREDSAEVTLNSGVRRCEDEDGDA